MPSTNASPGGRVIVLFRVRGVDVGFTPSWLIMVTVLSLLFRQQIVSPQTPKALGAAISVGLTLLFYTCVLLHEAAHTVVAYIFGLQPRRIVLFMLGGVSQIGRDAEDPKQECLVALAGPLTSLVIAGVFALVAVNTQEMFTGVWGRFAVVNLALALFNLIPGFPLDGGRVLRSTIWAVSGNRIKATKVAANGGRVVAAGLMASGIAYALSRAGRPQDAVQGVWILVLGYFLYSHASYAGREEVQREMIREQAQRDAMASAAATLVEPAADIIAQPNAKLNKPAAKPAAQSASKAKTPPPPPPQLPKAKTPPPPLLPKPKTPPPPLPPKPTTVAAKRKPLGSAPKPSRASGTRTTTPVPSATLARRGTTSIDITPSGRKTAGIRSAKTAVGKATAKKTTPKKKVVPNEGNAAKPKANRGGVRGADSARSAQKTSGQSRIGAGDSRRGSADAGRDSRRRG